MPIPVRWFCLYSFCQSSHQIHRRVFQHTRQQGIDAAAALAVELLFELQESLPLFDGKLGHPVPPYMGAPPHAPGVYAERGAPAPPDAGAPPRAPGDFLAKRKSPKIRQEPPGSWTSGTRGRTPLDSPALCPSGIGCDSLNPQASSNSNLPRHGLTAGSVTLVRLGAKNKTDLPTNPKWQIGLDWR